MEISAVDRSSSTSSVASSPAPADWTAEDREVVRAVKALNGTEMFGQDNQLMFRRDPETKRMVIRVVNRKTEEVITQIPPEYVLRLAEEMKRQSQQSR